MGKGRKRKACVDRAQRAAAEAANLVPSIEGKQQCKQAGNNSERRPHRRYPAFSPEPTGSYVTATDNNIRIVDMLHGEIVNRLADELEARGYEVANTGLSDGPRVDLVVSGNKRAIIEVKTGCTLKDIIEILGQLFLYDYRLGSPGKTRLKAVVPLDISKERAAVLRHYKICLIRWKKCGDEIVFKGLNSSFPQREKVLREK